VGAGGAAGGRGPAAEPFLVVAEGAGPFADAVCRLLSDPDERARRSRDGRRLVETEWGWEPVLDRMRALVAEAASEPRGGVDSARRPGAAGRAVPPGPQGRTPPLR
jgi:hypothetical protein